MIRGWPCPWVHGAFLAALVFRGLLASWTPLPSEDGVVYLWMAERFAAGEWSVALQEVFPPLWPLTVGVGAALTGAEGVQVFPVAQVLAALLGALAVYPVAALVRRALGGGAVTAAWCVASAPLLARAGAEGYSEALFVTLTAWGLVASVGERHVHAGVWSGLAYLTRPEGLALAGAHVLWGPGALRHRLLAGVGPLMAVGLRIAGRAVGGQTAEPLPVWTFNNGRQVEGLMDVPGNLLELPLAMAEAFGPLLLLALLGLWRGGSRGRRRMLWGSVGISWLAGLVGILLFVVRRRFLVSWQTHVTVFAVRGLAVIPRRLRVPALTVLCAYGVAVGLAGVTDKGKLVERDVGHWLQETIPPEHDVVSDFTRVLYFAGRRPNPPTTYSSAQLLSLARRDGVTHVVLHGRRETFQSVRAGLGDGWVLVPLPEHLAGAAALRGLVVLGRR